MTSLFNLVRRGNLRPLHDLIGRRRWEFSHPRQFGAWLKGHLEVARSKEAVRVLKQLQYLSPEDLQATFAKHGIKLVPFENSDKKFGEPNVKQKEYSVERESREKQIAEKRKAIRSMPLHLLESNDPRDFREWMIRQAASRSDSTAWRTAVEITGNDWEERRTQENALRYIHSAQALSKTSRQRRWDLLRSAHFLSHKTLVFLAGLGGMELDPAVPRALYIPPMVLNMLKRELGTVNSRPKNTEEMRHWLGRFVSIYQPHFRKKMTLLARHSPTAICGAMGLPGFYRADTAKKLPTRKLRRKQTELRDKAFQRALRNRLLGGKKVVFEYGPSPIKTVPVRKKKKITSKLSNSVPNNAFQWETPEEPLPDILSSLEIDQEKRESELRARKEQREKFRELETQVIEGILPGAKGLVWRKPTKSNAKAQAKIRREITRRRIRRAMRKEREQNFDE